MKRLITVFLLLAYVFVDGQVPDINTLRIGTTHIRRPLAGPNYQLSKSFFGPFTNVTGTASQFQTVDFTASQLIAHFIVTNLAGMEISKDGTTWVTTTLDYTPTGGVASGTIYVRVKSTTGAQHLTGTIGFSSTNAVGPVSIAIDATISASGSPVITISPTSINLGTTTQGSPGTIYNITVNGANLTHDITILFRAGTQGSVDNGLTFGTNPTITQTGGSVNGFIMKVRLDGITPANYSSNITLSSIDASDVNLPYTGTITSSGGGGGGTEILVADINFSQNPQDVPGSGMINKFGNPNCFTDSSITDYRVFPLTFTICPSKWDGGGVTDNGANNGCPVPGLHASSDALGVSNSTITDATSGLSAFFNFKTTWNVTTYSDTNIVVSGLTPGKHYRFWFFCSDGTSISCPTGRRMTPYCYDSTSIPRRVDSVHEFQLKQNTSDSVNFTGPSWKLPDADGKIRFAWLPMAGGNSSNCSQFAELNRIKIYQEDSMYWWLLLGLVPGLFRKRKKGVVVSLLLLSSLGLFAQDESPCLPAYDTSFVMLGISGGANITWKARISRHADNLLYTGIFCMPGDGELGYPGGNDSLNLEVYMYHWWIKQGWDGSVVLGDGHKRYPNVITLIFNNNGNSTLYGVYAQQVIDSLKRIYHMSSANVIGLSKGSETWMRMIEYQNSPTDFHAMDLIRSGVFLEGSSAAVDGINKTAGYAPMGTWANRGGRGFFIKGSADNIGSNVPPKLMNDSLAANGKPKTTFGITQNFGGGKHCCWNEFSDPNRNNFITWGYTVNDATNQIFNYSEPENIWQWIYRQQKDTSVVGGCSPGANAGVDQVLNTPTSSTSLTGVPTYNCGHTSGSVSWAQVSGPNTSSIGSPSSNTTTVSGLVPGLYTYRYTVIDNTTATISDLVTVQVLAQIPPTVSAGPDQSLTLPTSSATLSGTATANGAATLSSTTWSQQSGPNASSIASSGSLTTTISGLIQGVYVYRLTALDNNGNTNFDEVTLTVISSGTISYIYPAVGVGEYQVGFLDSNQHWFGQSNVLKNIGFTTGGVAGRPNLIPVVPSNLQFLECAGGLHYLAAIDVNHFIWTVGDKTNGQKGDGSSGSDTSAPYKILVDSAGNPMDPVDHLESYFSNNVAAGWYAWQEGSRYFYIWANTTQGMRGDGSFGLSISPRPVKLLVPDGKFIKNIIAGNTAMLQCTNGDVYTTGGGGTNWQDLGYVGTGTQYLTWRQIASGVKLMAAGKSYNFLLMADGVTLKGYGFFGGYMGAANNGVRYATPTDLTADITSYIDGNIAEMACNALGTYILSTTGKLYFFGDNAMAGLGNGVELDFANIVPVYAFNFANYQLPIRHPTRVMPNKSNFKHLWTGCEFIFFQYVMDSTGQMYAWGRDKSAVIATGLIPCSGTIESPYPQWADITRPRKVNPFTLTSTYTATCPVCLIRPDSPSCSNCSLAIYPVPIANAGANQSITVSNTSLDASGSSGSSGAVIMSYTWTQISGPSTATIEDPGNASTPIRDLVVGDYVFEVLVQDNGWKTSTARVTIHVEASATNSCNCVIIGNKKITP